VNAFSRYSGAANEVTGHFDLNVGCKKIASLTSFTYSSFGDLEGGKNQNPFYTTSYGERPNYVERINGKDSLVANNDRYLQKQSAYSQYDFLEKIAYKQSEKVTHGLNFQYSSSTDMPRYDRLTDPKGTGLSYAEWYYGPQERMLTAYDLNIKNPEATFQNIHFGANYQGIEESRHSRKFGKNDLAHRIENVNVLGLSLDFQKIIKSHNIRFGLDGQYNSLKSTANNENIVTGISTPLDTRYPDGDNNMTDAALYISHTWQINEQLVLNDGLRIGYSTLHSTFVDTSFYHLPYTVADQKTPVYSGSIGIINNPTDDWKLSAVISTGFRVPNVDDLSKVFESAAGSVIVPNPDLKPERTVNTEIGITKVFNNNAIWENYLY
jgi:hemoglobin/transferrin/lactoferrin receptor protein